MPSVVLHIGGSVIQARVSHTVWFDVGQRWGTEKVTVSSGSRSTRVLFAVKPRRG